jgi:methylglutaconyl-CoA hydratase
MPHETIIFSQGADGVARLTLNRPEAKNAMNGTMYDEAREVVAAIDRDPAIRVVVLSGAGAVFCSGGDFKYQQSQAQRPHADRIAEASKLALWLGELDRLSKPVIGRINGGAYGGGLGLVSVCDVAIAPAAVKFCLTEASLGLMPSMISPYVVRKMGVSNARSVFLNSRVFSAQEALGFGVLHEVVEDEAALDAAVDRQVKLFLRCAPGAVAATKRLVDFVDRESADASFRYTVDLVAEMWSSEEAAEGIASFLDKREPNWRTGAVSNQPQA